MNKGQTRSSNSQFATLDPRTQRAVSENMSIAPLGTGVYRVLSQSGETYLVDLPTGGDEAPNRSSATCTCPDYGKGTQGDDCKHIRRVKLDIVFSRLPGPETAIDKINAVDDGPDPSGPTSPLEGASLATDGGAIQSGSTQGDGASPSPHTPAGPEVSSNTPSSVYHQIAERIKEIEAEVDRYHAELQELETALSVFDECGEK